MYEEVYSRLSTITEEDVLKIHRKAAKGEHRGTGVRNWPKFRKLVSDVRRDATERRPFLDMIADLFDGVERDPQPFVECNHRTAMHLGRFIAFEFGLKIKYSGPEGKKLRARWPEMSRNELKEWVSSHLVPLEGD